MIDIIRPILASLTRKIVAAWTCTASKLPRVAGYAEVRGHLRIGRPPRQRRGNKA